MGASVGLTRLFVVVVAAVAVVAVAVDAAAEAAAVVGSSMRVRTSAGCWPGHRA